MGAVDLAPEVRSSRTPPVCAASLTAFL